MRILITCESSGTEREAFRKLGHEAWSSDMLPADDGSPYHIQGDCVAAVNSQQWDLIIRNPPCKECPSMGNDWKLAQQ
jgi:hypothetical protein